MSGTEATKPFCFVRFKEKSVQDQVLNQPHCLFGRYVDAEISKTQQAELALGHWEIVAKIDQDLKTGPQWAISAQFLKPGSARYIRKR